HPRSLQPARHFHRKPDREHAPRDVVAQGKRQQDPGSHGVKKLWNVARARQDQLALAGNLAPGGAAGARFRPDAWLATWGKDREGAEMNVSIKARGERAKRTPAALAEPGWVAAGRGCAGALAAFLLAAPVPPLQAGEKQEPQVVEKSFPAQGVRQVKASVQ